jgi:Protein of unknown function (DUF2892)
MSCHLQEGGSIMKCNSGVIDRVLRVVIGLALVIAAASGTIGWWGYIGVIPLLTGAIGWCPAYTILGIRTCKTT